ncbi:MAG: hypothetical protein JWR51_224 [Devosia sp.]|uniref:hypothetical protein n=1 Tax=Devosia sp. TaxID=1871048 RepID=UPI00261FB1C0|nr:hypothetical protein [Devosia sp.]MDB5527121.1 hypothetical protein [Devosia sp.]
MRSRKLRIDDLGAAVGGMDIPVQDLFPHFHRYDRLGIVIRQSAGAVGASLLIEAFQATYFAHRRAIGLDAVHYPEMYAFHVGGRHGDMRMFDFEPMRKEVFVDTPEETLAAVNQCGVTRILIPENKNSKKSYRWEETGAAKDRIKSVFVYSPTGMVQAPQFSLRSELKIAFDSVLGVIDPQHTLEAHTAGETPFWRDTLLARLGEIPPSEQSAARARLEMSRANGHLTESYRTADMKTLLACL